MAAPGCLGLVAWLVCGVEIVDRCASDWCAELGFLFRVRLEIVVAPSHVVAEKLAGLGQHIPCSHGELGGQTRQVIWIMKFWEV